MCRSTAEVSRAGTTTFDRMVLGPRSMQRHISVLREVQMIKIEPATLHRSDDPRLSAISAALVGERLVAARYAVPAGVSWEGYGGLEHVHEVDMGVELVTESGLVLGLSWSTPGREEGLSLALDRAGECPSNELIDLVDVSGQSEWSRVLGRLVEVVGVSFHVHADDSSIRPWAFRIGASGGTSVTVALGEVSDNVLRYMPDNIVVIFDEAVAREYQIPSSSQAAWGEIVRNRG